MGSIIAPSHVRTRSEDQRRLWSRSAGDHLKRRTARQENPGEDRLDYVGLVSSHDHTSKTRDARSLLGKPAAGSAAHEMRLDRRLLPLAVLAVQPGGETFLAPCAIHTTMVAQQIHGVPANRFIAHQHG